VVLKFEASRKGYAALALFDLGIEKLLDPPAIDTHQMVVMLALIELKNCINTR
jgi:hypothetical protein